MGSKNLSPFIQHRSCSDLDPIHLNLLQIQKNTYVYREAKLSVSEKPARNKSVQAKIHVHTLPRRNILVT